MDSNSSRHCPSRSSADNLGKQPGCTEDQKDPKALPSSCASSSAADDRNPSPGMEAGGNRPPSICGMEEIAGPVTEGAVLGMKNKEESAPPTTSQTVEWCKGEVSQKSSELSAPSAGPLSCSGGGGGGGGSVEPCASELLAEPRVSSPHPSSSTCHPTSSKDTVLELASQENATASSQGTKRSHEEVEKEEECLSPVKQKNKKRCFRCSAKLELAQREIGRCRCGGVFCATHRHPEAHSCDFDHKEDGRREAREKMVKPTRHLGTSFRRLEHS